MCGRGQTETRLVVAMMRRMTHTGESRGANILEHMRADISEHTDGSTQVKADIMRAHI